MTDQRHDDPLHPLMPLGVFRDWLDFVERVARPIVEAEDDDATEHSAMALYRKASPYFICVALVMAANERDRLRAGIMTAEVHGEMIVRMREPVWREFEDERDRLRAVVKRVQRLWRERGEMQATEALEDAALEEWRQAWDDFIALDASPTGEDT